MTSKKCSACHRKSLQKSNIEYASYENRYFQKVSSRAKKKRIEFSITIEYMFAKLEEQDFKCALSGLDIIIEKSINRKKGCSNITASLDRINSSIGYEKENVQWVHKDINYMKQDLNEDYFKNLCKLITQKWETSL